MGIIIACAQSKGGSGKTTLVSCLAADLATSGYRVCVVDSDRNQTFASWHASAYEGPAFTCVSEVDHIRVVDLAGEMAESHDVVLVDTAGFENLTAASAIGMADYVLIPCMPDRGSVRETLRTAQQVTSLSKAARRPIPHSVVLTRWKPRGLSERAALDSLREAGLPILDSMISDTAEYSKLSFSGAVPVTGKVRTQVSSLIEELRTKGVIPPNQAKGARKQAA
ncbi:MAG TPA: ParA family protein [Geminicoccaceae bacterium]|nr:ParA family protein [Geminicoccaceae bacterium]